MALEINKTYLDIWNEYISLEKEFKRILENIPLVDEHLGVWSLKIGDALIVLGSVLDSYLKFAITDTSFDFLPNIADIRNKIETNMGDYREIFENYYNLSIKFVYIRPLDKRIQPFTNWAQSRSLQWWEAYQKVKHNRFTNKKEATINNLLDGMAGLFLLHVIHIPSRIVLLRLNLWQNTWGQNYGRIYLEDAFNRKEPVGEPGVFYLETDLFGYILESSIPDSKEGLIWKNTLALLKEPRC